VVAYALFLPECNTRFLDAALEMSANHGLWVKPDAFFALLSEIYG
jgi:hypothetical protein